MRLVSELEWAVMTIWQEARSEAYIGMLAVAEVIRNRTSQRFRSDGTVASTVLWDRQFSGWNSRDPNRVPAAKLDDNTPSVRECIRAWTEATSSVAPSNVACGALFYFNPAVVVPPWKAEVRHVVTVGRHEFYVPK